MKDKMIKSIKIQDFGGDNNCSSLASYISLILTQKVLESGNGSCLFSMTENGTTNEKFEYFSDQIKSQGFKCVEQGITSKNDHYRTEVWLNDNSAISLSYDPNSNNYFSVGGYSLDKQFLSNFTNFCKDAIQPVVRKGHIFSLVQSGGQLTFQSVGNAAKELRRENYSDLTIKAYDEAVEDLNDSAPKGRIVILEGDPGSGKTTMVKSFLLEVPDGMFILISPDMVQSLDGPQLLPLIMQYKTSYCPNGPIVFVLEDADKCLVKRGSDNMSSIQALLNLSDGILGSLLDLRLIATTNAKKLEIEPAILRAGRLSKRLDVGPLSQKDAIRTYKSLFPNEHLESDKLPKILLDKQSMILADIYSLARENGWKPEKKSK